MIPKKLKFQQKNKTIFSLNLSLFNPKTPAFSECFLDGFFVSDEELHHLELDYDSLFLSEPLTASRRRNSLIPRTSSPSPLTCFPR